MGENKKVFLSYLPSTKVANLTSNVPTMFVMSGKYQA